MSYGIDESGLVVVRKGWFLLLVDDKLDVGRLLVIVDDNVVAKLL